MYMKMPSAKWQPFFFSGLNILTYWGWDKMAEDNFQCIFFKENVCILIPISQKFVPKGPVDKNPPLVQIMAWCQTEDKPLIEPMMLWFTDAYMHHSASVSWLNFHQVLLDCTRMYRSCWCSLAYFIGKMCVLLAWLCRWFTEIHEVFSSQYWYNENHVFCL